MPIFFAKPKPAPSRAEALDNFRGTLGDAVARAREAGIDSRQIAGILEHQADIARQRDALTRAVL